MRRRGVDSYLQDLNLPEIRAERCVHALVPNAGCRACIEVCHASAWQLDEEQLGIDAALCDGCGICAAVCPEAAIEHQHNPLSIHWRDEQIALIACEKISDGLLKPYDGTVSCVHALGARDLLKLYAAGHRRLLISTASCKECNRGAGMLLDRHLDSLNSLLRKRDEPPLERVNINAEQWINIIRSADHSNTGKKVSRRHLLRQVVSEVGNYGLRHFELSVSEDAAPPSIAELLDTEADEKALPFVPEIDIRRCTACNVCINLCPHNALELESNNGSAAYLINAVNCTACGICIDVCEDSAIEINNNTVALQTHIALSAGCCQSCGVHFHTLDTKPANLCRICQQKNHHNQLFQVLD